MPLLMRRRRGLLGTLREAKDGREFPHKVFVPKGRVPLRERIFVPKGKVPLRERIKGAVQPKTFKSRMRWMRAKQFARFALPVTLEYASQEADQAGFDRAAFWLRTGALGAGLWAAWEGLSDEMKHKAANKRRAFEDVIIKKRPAVVGYAITGSFCPAVVRIMPQKEVKEIQQKTTDYIKALGQTSVALQKELVKKVPLRQRVFAAKPSNIRSAFKVLHKVNPSYAQLVVDYANAMSEHPPAFARLHDPQMQSIRESFVETVRAGAQFNYKPRPLDPNKIPVDLPLVFYSKLMDKALPQGREKRATAVVWMTAAWLGAAVRRLDKTQEQPLKQKRCS